MSAAIKHEWSRASKALRLSKGLASLKALGSSKAPRFPKALRLSKGLASLKVLGSSKGLRFSKGLASLKALGSSKALRLSKGLASLKALGSSKGLRFSKVFIGLLALACLCACAGGTRGEASQSRRIMGGLFVIEAYGEDSGAVARAVDAAFAEAEELDRLLTTYDPGSQVMEINRSAGDRWVQVDPRVLEVLLAARKWWKASDGAFDPTVGPQMNLWGIPTGEGPGAYPPSLEQLRDTEVLVGMDKLILDDITGAVRLDREGMSLDLGGIGKGFAVDAAVRILQERGVRAARVEAAGDLRVFGEPPGGGPWKIAVPHPRDPEKVLTELEVTEGAVSISTDRHKRVFVRASQGYHTHVLDPRTGIPVEGMALFAVLAPTATTADALCTAAFVLGRGPGLQLLRGIDEAEGFVVYFDPDNVGELKGAGTPAMRSTMRIDL